MMMFIKDGLEFRSVSDGIGFVFGSICIREFVNDPLLFFLLQAIPRTVWLDPNRRQLLQWPVEELNELRGKKVEMSHQKLYKGQHVQIEGITAAQVCDISGVDEVFLIKYE